MAYDYFNTADPSRPRDQSRPHTAPARSPRGVVPGSFYTSFYGAHGAKPKPAPFGGWPSLVAQYRNVPSGSKFLPSLPGVSGMEEEMMPVRPGTATLRPERALRDERRTLKRLEVGLKRPFKSWTSPDVVFDQIDRDGSGSVEMGELHRFFRGKLDAGKLDSMFAELDHDGSGSVSREEWRKGYFNAGFGAGTIVGQSSEGLGVLLGLVSHSHKVDFKDLSHDRFPATILKPEERGITLAQLRELYAHLVSRAGSEGWMGMSGELVTADTATMYDVVRYVIKPATRSSKCSYVEFISPTVKQLPLWCVSHWWGTPFKDMLECLEQHARDRGIPDYAPYWISALATNQHGARATELADDVSLAYRNALQIASGTVAVIDRHGTALRRVWLLFELNRTLADLSLKLDLYTQLTHVCSTTGRIDGTRHRVCTAVGLCDGFAMTDLRDYERNKVSRESFFPLSIIFAAFNIRFEDAHASVEADRRSILSAISGSAPLEAPPKEHPQYGVASNVLRARFAGAALRSAADSSSELYAQCIEAISASCARKLNFPFTRCRAFNAKRAIALANALPRSLEILDMGFHDVEGGDAFVKVLGARLLHGGGGSTSDNGDGDAHQGSFGGSLTYLGLKSNTLTREGVVSLGAALTQGSLPRLRTFEFGLPVPFDMETANELAQGVLNATASFPTKVDFFGGRLSSYVQLSRAGLTSADLILIVASAATGSFGPLISLDVSHNDIDNKGIEALERALKPPMKKLPDLRIIDISHNKETTQAARVRVLEARRMPKPPPGDRMMPRYELSPSHEFRILLSPGYWEDAEDMDAP